MEPNIENIEKIVVVGAGAMGSQIGMVCALAGYDVTVQDIDGEMLEKAQEQLRSRMDRNVEKGRMSEEDVAAAFGRVVFVTDLEGPAAEADFIIEAVVEKLGVKR
jgi:3-hydroxybutyryl-CoA dehydrogenase